VVWCSYHLKARFLAGFYLTDSVATLLLLLLLLLLLQI
jgi:hypothetical protein